MKNLFSIPAALFGRKLTRRSVLSAVGGYAAGEILKHGRRKWEAMEPGLENINAYNLGRGAGLVIAGWLEYAYPDYDLNGYAEMLEALIAKMDKEDELVEDRARSRYVASKILFHLEGFKLAKCRYELFQDQARALLRKKPECRNLSRRDIFLGNPFEAEYLIGTTHRMLLMLSKKDSPHLAKYLDAWQEKPCRDATEHFARLIVLTFGVKENTALLKIIRLWFEDYRAYEIRHSHNKEKWIATSIGVAAGELPAMAGMEVLSRIYNGLAKKNGKKKK